MHVSIYQYMCAHTRQYRLAGIDSASSTKHEILVISVIMR